MFSMDPVTILLSIIVILFVIKTYNDQKYKNYPPGPRSLPFIGHLHLVDARKPHSALMKLSEKYGTVFSFKMAMQKMVVLCGYDTVNDALINRAEEFSDRPHFPMPEDTLFSYGIVFSNGENWKAMRRFTLTTLRDFGMGKRSIQHQINEEAQCLMQEFRSYKGEPFENTAIINTAVANIIVSILLGNRFEYGDPTILKLMHMINENFKNSGSIMTVLYTMFPKVMRLIPGSHQKTFQNIKGLLAFIREEFTTRKKTLDVNDQRTFIDAFLAKQQEEKPESPMYFHNDNLCGLVSNLFVAGMETTSTTLRWGLLLMIKYPEIQKKVHDEIDRVIGSAEPQIEHRKLMPYTDAVIHEVQRFGDILPMNVAHATAKDITFRGYNIPKGTIVIPLLTSVLRDKAYFEKPDEFYPEHFLDSEGNLKKSEAFIPFSLGKRSCAGENLATMELFLFFTTLLQNFIFQALPGDELDLTPALGFTNAPLAHKMCAIPRT